MNKNNQISINSLSGIKDFSLDKGKVSGFIDTVKPFLAIIYPAVFIGAYFVGFMIIISKMIYLLFGAFLIWVVVKIKGLDIGYKKSYIVGMPLMTAAIIITSLLWLAPSNYSFTFLFSILLIISAAIKFEKGECPIR